MIPGWDGHFWDDHSVILLIALAVAAIVAGASVLSLAQRAAITLLVRRYPKITDPAMLDLARRLAAHLGVACPTLRLCHSTYPVASVGGVRGMGNQTILLSSWVLSNLDEEEREAVLAHELAHIRRRDDLMLWAAQLLRDIAFYLPGIWQIWRAMQQHIQIACDESVGQLTGRRLALASALCKAELQALQARPRPSWSLGPGLLSSFSNSEAQRDRVTLLMGERQGIRGGRGPRAINLTREWLFGIIAFQGLFVASIFYFLCCGGQREHIAMLVLLGASASFLTLMFLRLGRARLGA
jgi:hypothetical protein